MEAEGLYKATYFDTKRTDALMIRGISDYADENKKTLEKATKDQYRAYAAANTARLLRAVWRRGPVAPLSPGYMLDVTMGPHSPLSPTRYVERRVEEHWFAGRRFSTTRQPDRGQPIPYPDGYAFSGPRYLALGLPRPLHRSRPRIRRLISGTGAANRGCASA